MFRMLLVFSCFLLSLQNCGAMENENDLEQRGLAMISKCPPGQELYDLGTKFRDRKVENFDSKSDFNPIFAVTCFLKVGKNSMNTDLLRGNAYLRLGFIVYQDRLYELAETYFQKAVKFGIPKAQSNLDIMVKNGLIKPRTPLALPDEVFLVVGSVRKEGTYFSFDRQLFGEDCDFTHRKTFKGKAITLDIRSCEIPNLTHIQADASKPIACLKEHSVQAVCFELFPSYKDESGGMHSLKNLNESAQDFLLMPNAIKNIARYMKAGASLEIEHSPHFVSTPKLQTVQDLNRKNPFLYGLSPFFMESIKACQYPQDDEKCRKHWDDVLTQKRSLFQWCDRNSPDHLEDMKSNHHVVVQATKNIKGYFKKNKYIQDLINKDYAKYLKNADEFYENEFMIGISGLIGVEYGVLSQKESIKVFLEKNGFDSVELSRRDNPHNGRKMVWMISGIRNNEPVK